MCVPAPFLQSGAVRHTGHTGARPPYVCRSPCRHLAAPGTRRSETGTSNFRTLTSTPSLVKSRPQGAVPFCDSHVSLRAVKSQQGECPPCVPPSAALATQRRGLFTCARLYLTCQVRAGKTESRTHRSSVGALLRRFLCWKVRSSHVIPRDTLLVPVGQREREDVEPAFLGTVCARGTRHTSRHRSQVTEVSPVGGA